MIKPEILLYDSSKICVLNAAQTVRDNMELFGPMLRLGLSGKHKISSRALRVIAILSEYNPALLDPHIETIIDSAGKAEIESNKFNLLKLLTFTGVPEDEVTLDKIINLCYEAIETKTERIAIKVYALDILAAIVGKYPELAGELHLIIQKHYEYSTMAFRSRADRIMKKLGMNLYTTIIVFFIFIFGASVDGRSLINIKIDVADSSMSSCLKDLNIFFDVSIPVASSQSQTSTSFKKLNNKKYERTINVCDTVVNIKILPFGYTQPIFIASQSEIQINIKIKENGIDFEFPEFSLNKRIHDLIKNEYRTDVQMKSEIIEGNINKTTLLSHLHPVQIELNSIIDSTDFPNIHGYIVRKLELIRATRVLSLLKNEQNQNETYQIIKNIFNQNNKNDIFITDFYYLAYLFLQYDKTKNSDSEKIVKYIFKNFEYPASDVLLYKYFEEMIYFEKNVNSYDSFLTMLIDSFANFQIKEQAKYLYQTTKKENFQELYYGTSLFNPLGDTVTFDLYKGNVLYLDFWATWCKPCLDFIPALEQLRDELKDYEIKIISVAFENLKFNKWKNFIEKRNLTDVQLYAEYGFNNPIAKNLLLTYIPRFIIVDKFGKIIERFAPAPNEKGLNEYLIRLSKQE